MKTDFACVAEAVAYFFRLGFETDDSIDSHRVMRKGDETVLIDHVGFLTVKAEFV